MLRRLLIILFLLPLIAFLYAIVFPILVSESSFPPVVSYTILTIVLALLLELGLPYDL